MLGLVIILALLQPVCFWLGAMVAYRARNNLSPALRFPRKLEVGDDEDAHNGQGPYPITKGRPTL